MTDMNGDTGNFNADYQNSASLEACAHPACWCDEPVAGVAPCDGWTLWTHTEYEPDDRPVNYCAHRGSECRIVHVARNFTPTDARFAFMVKMDFPRCPPKPHGNLKFIRGAWFDDEIDAGIAAANAEEAFL